MSDLDRLTLFIEGDGGRATRVLVHNADGEAIGTLANVTVASLLVDAVAGYPRAELVVTNPHFDLKRLGP